MTGTIFFFFSTVCLVYTNVRAGSEVLYLRLVYLPVSLSFFIIWGVEDQKDWKVGNKLTKERTYIKTTLRFYYSTIENWIGCIQFKLFQYLWGSP